MITAQGKQTGNNLRPLAAILVLALIIGVTGCKREPDFSPDSNASLVAEGKKIFFTETFAGNGRTCATCHREEANFSIDPDFIATLPDNDPLFVAEFNPDLKENFEKPILLREFGLIVENLDGFDDLTNNFVVRGVPHVLALPTSVNSPQGPRTGWSGDGAPADGSLRAFSTGAVIQHFTKTLNRVAGVDFRLPTDRELQALEAFMLSLGRQRELALPLPLKGTLAKRGQELFLDNARSKCNLCHSNAGANANFSGTNIGNANFNTGVEELVDQPARLLDKSIPKDDGFGTPGDGTFNTPPLVEAADSGPFFHNNAIQTIEGAVAFYNSDAFNNSPAGTVLAGADPNGVGIKLDTTEVESIAAFLRVINVLENIRQSLASLKSAAEKGFFEPALTTSLLNQALEETEDSIQVLGGAGLHPQAITHLLEAMGLTQLALDSNFTRRRHIVRAVAEQENARAQLIETAQPVPKKQPNEKGK